MKSRLSATHLLRHLVLFVLIGLFLLTMTRAAYVVWQFDTVGDSILKVFATGFRFDLALLCALALPALVFGCLFGMLKVTKGIARFFVALILFLGMLFIVLTELATPYFIAEQSVRPDVAAFMAIEDPVELLAGLWSAYMIPAIIGVVLAMLIIIAYISRLELSRMFRYPIGFFSTILLLLVGIVLFVLGIYSNYDPSKPALSTADAEVSSEAVVNEITLNTGYKTVSPGFEALFSAVDPLLTPVREAMKPKPE